MWMPHVIGHFSQNHNIVKWVGHGFDEAITEEGPAPSIMVMRFESSLKQTLLTLS